MREKGTDRLQVVILTVVDNAGVGYRMKEAVELYSDKYKVIQIQARQHIHKHPTDIVMQESTAIDIYQAQSLIINSDLIHFKGDEADFYKPRQVFGRLKLPKDIPILHSVEGTLWRNATHPVAQRDMYDTPYKYVICHDLLDHDDTGEWKYMPQPFDCDDSPYLWKWPSKGRPIIAHSPTNRVAKGTDIILKVLENLNVEVRLIENVSVEESIEMKKDATIFIDSISTGGYGVSAQEAMQFGIPTISNLGYKDSGVIGLDKMDNFLSLYDKLKELLDNPQKLEEISKDTYKRIKEHHGYKTTGEQWSKLYDKVLLDSSS